MYAWGENKFGQIGNGSNNDQLENPIRIEGFDNEKAVMISCGAGRGRLTERRLTDNQLTERLLTESPIDRTPIDRIAD